MPDRRAARSEARLGPHGELQITDGRILQPVLTDYLIPTRLDVPPCHQIFEFPHPDSPYGLNGVGEPPNLSSTPAVLNALRDATGLDLPRAPVRPADLIASDGPEMESRQVDRSSARPLSRMSEPAAPEPVRKEIRNDGC
ncbi:MAG: hypothetical protein OXC00_02175 [Acidimicrobiaceae bacterium]|nr:hypothetical protein [Acidimicrobiaceae bacterium]